MWKRLKSPWTVVLLLVLAFAGVLGRGYYRSRRRAALVRESEGRRETVYWQYVGPPWLERFLLPKHSSTDAVIPTAKC